MRIESGPRLLGCRRAAKVEAITAITTADIDQLVVACRERPTGTATTTERIEAVNIVPAVADIVVGIGRIEAITTANTSRIKATADTDRIVITFLFIFIV